MHPGEKGLVMKCLRVLLLAAFLPGVAWAASSQVLTTPGYVVTITEQCAEGEVGCDNVLYSGVNRRSGKSLTLHGKALMHDCPGTTTPCHHIGWRFDNHGTTYTVTDAGVLEVTRGDKTLLRQTGTWQTVDDPSDSRR